MSTNAQFKSAYEAAQAWVSRTHTEGAALGVKFDSDYFYSGDTIVARLLNSAVVLSSTSFGMAVTKHRLVVEAATRDYKQVFVPFCELSLAENVTEAKEQIRVLLLKASTANVKRKELTEAAIEIAKGINMFAALLGDTSIAISMSQFENLDFAALKQEVRLARLPRSKKRPVKAGRKATYRSVSNTPDVLTPRTLRKEQTDEGLTISSAFSLLDGLHNMSSAGISIQEDIHASIHLPTRISPSGDITIGGHSVLYSDLQKVREILGFK